jgi:RNA polymerase sigma factor (sigma-70 family)
MEPAASSCGLDGVLRGCETQDSSWEALYPRIRAIVRRQFRRPGGATPPYDEEDIVQETCLRVLTLPQSRPIDDIHNLDAYIAIIVRRLILDDHRRITSKRNRRTTLECNLGDLDRIADDQARDPAVFASLGELHEYLEDVVAGLSARHQEIWDVLVGRESSEEAAVRMGMTPQTVRTIACRARFIVRERVRHKLREQ